MALRSRFGKRLLVAALSVAALAAGLVATPAAATHAGEWVLKPSFLQWTTDNSATWVNQRPAGFDANTVEYSSDSGATWTATQADYLAGEAGTDSSDGGNAGQFRLREPHTRRDIAEGDPRWSTDAGDTWTDQGGSEPSGFSFGTVQWSSDSGATWTATQAQYNTGEAGTDSNDGPDAGQFRSRFPYQRQRTWVCSGVESVELPPEFWRVGLCRVGVFVLYRREHVGAGVAAAAVVPLVDPGGDVSAGLEAGGVAAP